jgi:hypothetical protein
MAILQRFDDGDGTRIGCCGNLADSRVGFAEIILDEMCECSRKAASDRRGRRLLRRSCLVACACLREDHWRAERDCDGKQQRDQMNW